MTPRALGRSGLQVAPLALGGNVFGWTADEATSFAVLDAFVDGGFNLTDTADVYSRWAPGHQGGESEAVIGRWLKAPGNAAPPRHRLARAGLDRHRLRRPQRRLRPVDAARPVGVALPNEGQP
jgi:aryl-alcohol dehydrogenase-like predicted oxidoreductase